MKACISTIFLVIVLCVAACSKSAPPPAAANSAPATLVPVGPTVSTPAPAESVPANPDSKITEWADNERSIDEANALDNTLTSCIPVNEAAAIVNATQTQAREAYKILSNARAEALTDGEWGKLVTKVRRHTCTARQQRDFGVCQWTAGMMILKFVDTSILKAAILDADQEQNQSEKFNEHSQAPLSAYDKVRDEILQNAFGEQCSSNLPTPDEYKKHVISGGGRDPGYLPTQAQAGIQPHSTYTE